MHLEIRITQNLLLVPCWVLLSIGNLHEGGMTAPPSILFSPQNQAFAFSQLFSCHFLWLGPLCLPGLGVTRALVPKCGLWTTASVPFGSLLAMQNVMSYPVPLNQNHVLTGSQVIPRHTCFRNTTALEQLGRTLSVQVHLVNTRSHGPPSPQCNNFWILLLLRRTSHG